MIKKASGKWVLYTSDGSKILGRHSTRAEALKQEQAIKASKARRGKQRGR